MYSALGAKYGIEICIESDVSIADVMNQYYIIRRETDDPALRALSFVRSPNDPRNLLWIVKSARNADGKG